MRKRISPTIELIPLIDTMFLLLIFFIYAVVNLTATKQLPVNLPEIMKAIKIDKDYQQIMIKEDSYFLNDNKVTLSGLKSLPKDKKVYIAADKNVKYLQVVEVLNILKNNGVNRISLEVK